MRREAARLAVEGPLRGTGRSFAEGVASTMVQELVGIRVESAAGETVEAAGEYVEPVQLQVVCQNLWLELPPETTLITTNHLRTFGDVNEALKTFYSVAFSPDSRYLATASQDRTVRVYALAIDELIGHGAEAPDPHSDICRVAEVSAPGYVSTYGDGFGYNCRK